MKIGIISNLYPPFVRGGAENVVVRTVEALTSRGHEVFVISARPWRRGQGIVINNNSTERVYQFFPRNFYFVLNDSRYRWFTRLLWHIVDTLSAHSSHYVCMILEEEKPDIVITHNLKGIGLRIPKVIQCMNIPYIHVVHDLQLLIPSGLRFAGKEREGFSAMGYRIYRAITKHLFGTPDIVVFPSEYLKNEYTSQGFFEKSNIVILQNPAPSFPAKYRRVHTTDAVQLLFVGQLEDHKGIRFLMDAVAKYGPSIRLHIAGEGTLAEEVKKYAKLHDNITYLGYIAIDQLLDCFDIVDALIVPSLCYENSPTVIYESLQAGVPVLASDIGGVGELVQHGKNGFLFIPGDVQDMLAKIEELRINRERFARACDDIRATVQPYSLDRYIGTLESMMHDIIDHTEKP